MIILIILMISIFIIPIIASFIYWIIILKKRYRFIDFSNCNLINNSKDNEELIKVLTSISQTVTNNVNAWLYLVWINKSLIFVLDIWCACYSLMSLFVLYNVKENAMLYLLISICAIVSLISSILSLCLSPQEKYNSAIIAWHKASEFTGNYQMRICELLKSKEFDKIIEATKEYQNSVNEISNGTII